MRHRGISAENAHPEITPSAIRSVAGNSRDYPDVVEAKKLSGVGGEEIPHRNSLDWHYLPDFPETVRSKPTGRKHLSGVGLGFRAQEASWSR